MSHMSPPPTIGVYASRFQVSREVPRDDSSHRANVRRAWYRQHRVSRDRSNMVAYQRCKITCPQKAMDLADAGPQSQPASTMVDVDHRSIFRRRPRLTVIVLQLTE